MIFSAPRYIVIDDKEKHLSAITNTFQLLGTSCVALRYNQEEEINFELFRGVRCLFMDLHLVDGQASTDQKRHYALIAQILEDAICENGGPFILVIWTEHPQYANELKEYLDKNLDKEKPHASPLAVMSLDKSSFINVDNGTITDPNILRDEINKTILSNPQLAALLHWELDVMKAAGDTLASFIGLVPNEKRNTDSFSEKLDELLSRLAREAVGISNIESDKRAALNSAFAPILIDRVINQAVSDSAKEVWNNAVTKYNETESASAEEAAQINRMLHIANPKFEVILPTDWGSVVEFSCEDSDDGFNSVIGITKKKLFCEEYKLRSSAIDSCKLILVRVGAACDYAQNSSGLITYLLAAEIPERAERQQSRGVPVKLSDSIWKSPVITLPDFQEPVRLHIHQRFPITILKKNAGGLKVKYRIREQMLMNIITSSSNYSSRPGMLQMLT